MRDLRCLAGAFAAVDAAGASRAGEKAFVDYSGRKPHIVNAQTGEVLFVMVLGAGNYTYA